ncbi:MAG: ComEC/Rec2 family competence protein, partial [Christensenellaceae bacterium]
MSARKRPATARRMMKRLASAAAVVVALVAAWIWGGGDSTPAVQRPEAGGQAMTVRFIDVGQGASTLVSMGDTHILIDAGENDQGDKVVEQLKAWGVDRLALAIGTHPHSDHIGGMDDVLNAFEVEAYMMPEVAHASKTYESVLQALEENEIPVTYPQAGDSLELGGMRLTVLGPEQVEEDDLNNCSLVSRVDSAYGSVLIPGDCERQAEETMLKGNRPLKADVLQLAHHGSSTSNTEAFLKAVDPKWVVIPVGEGNSYGHPHDEILQRVEELGCKAYRTDWNGTVTCVMDEEGIAFYPERE